jgi:heat shock protein HslJ
MKKLSSLLIILALFTSCKSSDAASQSPAKLNGTWELTEIQGQSFSELFSNSSIPNIQFDTAEMHVSGKNSCNQYSGPFTSEAGKLSFEGQRMISTKMFCEGSGEKSYMQALINSNEYQISDDGKSLTLLKDGKRTLTFSRK